jgi:predicted RNA-binding protein YlqC (UPF0109 family)
MNHEAQQIEKLANVICRGLVSKPESLHVLVNSHRLSKLISVEVVKDPVDQPKLIGREGANFKAMAVLLSRAGDLMGVDVELAIPSQSENRVRGFSSFRPNPTWNHKKMLNDLLAVCELVFSQPVEIDVYQGEITTTFDVGYSEDELANNLNINNLGDAICRIFHGHGKNQGREVKVKLALQAVS